MVHGPLPLVEGVTGASTIGIFDLNWQFYPSSIRAHRKNIYLKIKPNTVGAFAHCRMPRTLHNSTPGTHRCLTRDLYSRGRSHLHQVRPSDLGEFGLDRLEERQRQRKSRVSAMLHLRVEADGAVRAALPDIIQNKTKTYTGHDRGRERPHNVSARAFGRPFVIHSYFPGG